VVLFGLHCTQVTAANGILALASCSSHISPAMFSEVGQSHPGAAAILYQMYM
jgi:hypothetical protein